MKRKIEVKAGAIHIVATIDTGRLGLTRQEVEIARDDLADALQIAPTMLRYISIRRNRVKVK